MARQRQRVEEGEEAAEKEAAEKDPARAVPPEAPGEGPTAKGRRKRQRALPEAAPLPSPEKPEPRGGRAPEDAKGEDAPSVGPDEDANAEAAPRRKRRRERADPAAQPEDPVPEGRPASRPPKSRKRAGAAEAGGLLEEAGSVDEQGAGKSKRAARKIADEQEGAAKDDDATAKTATGQNASAEAQTLTVFVGGIPSYTDEEVLRRDFGECGEIAHMNLIKDAETGTSKGVAFITFANEGGAQAALKYDGDEYGGNWLRVRRAEDRGPKAAKAPPRNLEVFVKGLPTATTADSLRQHFSECGDIGRVNMPTRGTGRCKGFAWLTFETKAGMDKALELNGQAWCGSQLAVEAAGQHKPAGCNAAKGKGNGKGDVSTEREVFVSNFPYETQEADLRQDFLECGEIERIHVPLMRTGVKSMGFAWVTFATADGVEKALAYDGDDYGGRRLKVEKSGQHKTKAGGGKGDGKGAAE